MNPFKHLLARRGLVSALCAALAGLGGASWAQTQGAGPTVKLIVGYAARAQP